MKKYDILMKFHGIIATLALTVILGVGCIAPPEQTSRDAAADSANVAQADTAAGQPTVTIEATNWQLENLSTGAEVQSMAADKPLTAVFEDGQVSGSAGCNNFSGKYEIDESNLTIGPLLTTRKACADNDVMQREADFLTALQAVTSFVIKDDALSLIYPDGVLDFSVSES